MNPGGDLTVEEGTRTIIIKGARADERSHLKGLLWALAHNAIQTVYDIYSEGWFNKNGLMGRYGFGWDETGMQQLRRRGAGGADEVVHADLTIEFNDEENPDADLSVAIGLVELISGRPPPFPVISLGEVCVHNTIILSNHHQCHFTPDNLKHDCIFLANLRHKPQPINESGCHVDFHQIGNLMKAIMAAYHPSA